MYADLDGNGTINPANEIVEENNYYPFGLKHEGYNNLPGDGYKYKYNGKEYEDNFGLNMYEYGARNYDAAIGRWLNVDPLAEKMIAYSPYNYALNNPLIFVDEDGKEPVPWWVQRTNSQWYCGDSKSFNSAAIYNTNKLNSSAYQTISQRNDYYNWANSKLSNKSKWFEAADIVTRFVGVGAAEWINLGVIKDSSEKFLKEGNEYLFSYNMKNAKDLIKNGKLEGGFYSAEGEFVSFEGKRGRELDYAMVEYEQTKVSSFMTEYKQRNDLSDADMNYIIDNVSSTMKYSRGDVKKIMNKYFDGGENFNFGSYKHRLILGKALIDGLYEE